MVAPVLQGTGDSVLSDAVGHDPASAWPGQAGTSVLSAHDVTWFSRIGKLKPGNEIRYVTPCRTYTYKVTSHAIVAAGSPVYSGKTARLVLDTCYPLDALFITSTRYLVYADLITPPPRTPWPRHREAGCRRPSPRPQGSRRKGWTWRTTRRRLARSASPGHRPARGRQSSAPLQFEAAALAEYFGLIRSAAQEKRTWWADLAPSVPTPAAGAMWGGRLEVLRLEADDHAARRGTRPVKAT